MFENMEDDEDKARIVNEVLDDLPKVALNQWGAFVIQHSRTISSIYIIGWVLLLVIEHGTLQACQRTLTLLLDQLPLYASDDIGVKSLLKLVKPADPDVVSQVIDKMCQPNSAAHRRRAIIVDLALSVNGSQLIQHVLPMVSFNDWKRMSIDPAPGKQGAAHLLI
jgi:pumilio RNA-binding family